VAEGLGEVFNGLRWIVRTGSAWRYMPHELPTQGKPSTSRRGGDSLLAYSSRWSRICAYITMDSSKIHRCLFSLTEYYISWCELEVKDRRNFSDSRGDKLRTGTFS
jgi:hypothetical protein